MCGFYIAGMQLQLVGTLCATAAAGDEEEDDGGIGGDAVVSERGNVPSRTETRAQTAAQICGCN